MPDRHAPNVPVNQLNLDDPDLGFVWANMNTWAEANEQQDDDPIEEEEL